MLEIDKICCLMKKLKLRETFYMQVYNIFLSPSVSCYYDYSITGISPSSSDFPITSSYSLYNESVILPKNPISTTTTSTTLVYCCSFSCHVWQLCHEWLDRVRKYKLCSFSVLYGKMQHIVQWKSEHRIHYSLDDHAVFSHFTPKYHLSIYHKLSIGF